MIYTENQPIWWHHPQFYIEIHQTCQTRVQILLMNIEHRRNFSMPTTRAYLMLLAQLIIRNLPAGIFFYQFGDFVINFDCTNQNSAICISIPSTVVIVPTCNHIIIGKGQWPSRTILNDK